METNRIEWIDNWKGFMLIIVCLGHFYMPWPGLPLIMPIRVVSFFFISGFLFYPNKYKSFGEFCKRKWLTLLRPYIFLSLIFLFLNPKLYFPNLEVFEGKHKVLTYLFGIDPNMFSNTFDYFLFNIGAIFIEGMSSTMSGPLWFVFALFFVDIILYMTVRLGHNSVKIITLILLISLNLGWEMNIYDLRLPLNFDTILSALSIGFFGYLARPLIHLISGLSNMKLIAGAAVLSVFYLLGLNLNGNIDLYCNSLCNDMIGYVLTIICGMLTCVCFFILSARVMGAIRFLDYVAKNGIVILAAHFYAGTICRLCFYGIVPEGIFPYLQLLSAVLFCMIAIYFFNHFAPSAVGKLK